MRRQRRRSRCFERVTEIVASSLTQALALQGHHALHFSSIDSTMSEAARQAATGHAGPLWIIADSQSAGRGRHGREWTSPDGNLYATCLITDLPAARSPEIGFVAGLALHDAAAKLTGLRAPRLALKWPNDLLIDQAKCAGLLLEGQSRGDRFSLAIGFGVNVASAPSGTPYAAAALSSHAPDLARDALVLALADAFASRLADWRESLLRGTGFAPTRAAWHERAAFLGQRITLRLPEGAISGIFTDIDATGRLLLETDGCLRIIDVGDLFGAAPLP
jgi:BirA family transcriptional regulator, biotin operon repressor / biotin---[acetyl-CoA-carboxylase] ligase